MTLDYLLENTLLFDILNEYFHFVGTAMNNSFNTYSSHRDWP